MGIVVDSSASIGKKNFEKTKTFLTNFVKGFHIGPGSNDVRVALDVYGDGVYKDVSCYCYIYYYYIL